MTDHLRPIERRVLAMRQDGLADAEIGRRLRKSPEHIDRIAVWATMPGRGGSQTDREGLLTPIEQRVVDMRAAGLDHEEIGRRFRRSARYIRRVEGHARFRQYEELLG